MKQMMRMRLEWALVAVLAFVCVGISIIQYRWSEELGRAERSRMRGGLENSARHIVRGFESDVRSASQALLPTAREIAGSGLAEAYRRRYLEWKSAPPADQVFSRVAVEEGGAGFHLIDASGGMQPANRRQWEEEHADLVELPVFEGRGEQERRRIERIVLQVNREFVRSQLLPKLVREYLNPGPDPQFDVSVTAAGLDTDVVFSTRNDGKSVISGADLAVALLSANMGTERNRPEWERGRERSLAWEGRGGGEPRGDPPGNPSAARSGVAKWVLAIRHRDGSLEAAVSRSRKRNLSISFAMLGVLAGTAGLLVRVTARARRLSEMQFRFAVGVSHDLRTPLTAIRGASFNLVNGMVRDPDALNRYARLILRNSEELTDIVENVLAYTSALREGQPLKKERVDLSAMLENAAGTMHLEIQQAGCRMEVNVPAGLPCVEGEPMTLERAFRNLICNAVRYASTGGWIGISAAACDGGVEVRVSDRGPGIPKDEQSRIFEPFFRGEQARLLRVHGAGLGLSLVRSAVERHGGKIEIQSESGKGAEFGIWLPAIGRDA